MTEPIKEIAAKKSVEAVYTGGSVRWSPNGKKLFSTCTNVVKVIDLEDNSASYTIGDTEDELRITCTAIDKNRNRLLVAYNNQVIREYSIPLDPIVQSKPELARTWKTMHMAPILVMEFNEEGTLLATGAADHIVKIWNLSEQQCTHTLKGPSVVSSVLFGKNEKLVVGYIEGQLHLYNIMKGAPKKHVNTWNNHNSHITALLQVPDSRIVVALSRDQTMSIHETETQETLRVLPLYESIESGAIGHNGNLFTVGEEGVVKEWLIETAKLIRKKRISSAQIDEISYDVVSNRFLAVSAEQNLIVLDFESLRICRQIVGFHDEIYSCCLLGKGETHMAVASNTSEIRLYNTGTLDCQLIRGHSESVLSVVSPSWDTSLLASCSKDNAIILWRLVASGEPSGDSLVPLCAATGHANTVTALAVSNSGRAPFLASVSSDCTIKLWALDLKMKEAKIDGDQDFLEQLPKLTCSSTMVAHGKDVNCVDISESDALIATGGMDKLVKLWQVDTQKMQIGIAGTLSGHRRGVGDVKFAKNSHRLASCSGDMTIKIWNIAEKTCLQTISGHSCAVFRVIFVRNDTQLVSADSAGIIKIWTIKSADCESSIDAHTDKIWSLSKNRDESEFVTAGTDGRIVVWKDVTEEKQRVEDEKRREAIEQDQTLTNLLSQKRYSDALVFALTLAKPFCAFKVINALMSSETSDDLHLAISRLDQRQIEILLQFCVKWNTNSRHSPVAQRVLFEIIHIIDPEKLVSMPGAYGYIESLLPYTQRHMDRLDRAKQDVSLFDFVWRQMRSSV